MEPDRCACGRPLHYSSPTRQKVVDDLVRRLGRTIRVVAPSGAYQVDRHYIALHGLKAAELPDLARRGIVQAESDCQREAGAESECQREAGIDPSMKAAIMVITDYLYEQPGHGTRGDCALDAAAILGRLASHDPPIRLEM